jgi:hypothetical protein
MDCCISNLQVLLTRAGSLPAAAAQASCRSTPQWVAFATAGDLDVLLLYTAHRIAEQIARCELHKKLYPKICRPTAVALPGVNTL